MSLNLCVFCQIVAKQEPADIVYEDDLCMAFLDKYPQTRGQLQLIPKKHYRWIYEVPQMGQIFAVAQTLIRAIIPVLGADHVTLATLGHEVKHAHIWIMPQYKTEVVLKEGLRNKGSSGELLTLLKQAINSTT